MAAAVGQEEEMFKLQHGERRQTTVCFKGESKVTLQYNQKLSSLYLKQNTFC